MACHTDTSRRSTATRRTIAIGGCYLLAMALAFGPDCSATLAGNSPLLEYKVKAGYLFNFAKVVEWPVTALPASDSPFVIGVIDRGEVLPIIGPLLEGKVLNGHPVHVQSVAADKAGSGVHVLFVTREAGKSPEEIRASLGKAQTLLVGETDGFAQRGGAVNFVTSGNSIKFEANAAAASRSGLKLGSQLLKLAIVVEDARPPGKD